MKAATVNLARSWLIQNLSFGGLVEGSARVILESGVCLLLAFVRWGPVAIIAGWVAVHTALWLLVYGGFSRVRVLLEIPAPLPRLNAFLDRTRSRVGRRTEFRIALLRGSAARGKLTELSDIDILLVPRKSVGAKLRGILFLWSIRFESVLARVPLQARWVDREVFVSLNVVGETPISLLPGAGAQDGRARPANQGLLVAVSGRDSGLRGSVARGIAEAIRARGIEGRCISGIPSMRPGRLKGVVANRFVLGLRACVYLLRWRRDTSRDLQPGKAAVLDGYLADFWVDLDAAGPVPGPLRTLMVGIAPTPDAAFLLEPSERDVVRGSVPADSSSIPHAGYLWYGRLLGMTSLEAGGGPEEVIRRVLAELDMRLGIL